MVETPRTAIVVIHGIGQQQRYDTRRCVVENLLRHGVTRVGDGVAVSLSTDSAPAESIRLRYPQAEQSPEADVFEAYWAPLMAGKTSFRVLSASFLRDTLVLPRCAQLVPGRPRKIAIDVGYTLAGIGLLLALLFFAWAFLAIAVEMVHGQPVGVLSPLTLPLSSVATALSKLRFWEMVAGAMVVYLISQVAFQLLTVRKWQNRLGPSLTILISGAALALLIWLACAQRSVAVLFLALSYASFRGLTRAVQRWVVDYLGDIQVYSTFHETDAKFAAREAVLARVSELIERIHAQDGYDRLVVVGHSLGTVIAVDVLWRLAQRAVRDPGLALPKIRCLITCGTALEKTRLLLALKGNAPGPEPWFKGLSDGDPNNWAQMAWLNFWYDWDVVANRIDPRHYRDYGPPNHDPGGGNGATWWRPDRPWVHSNYFHDPRFVIPLRDRSFT